MKYLLILSCLLFTSVGWSKDVNIELKLTFKLWHNWYDEMKGLNNDIKEERKNIPCNELIQVIKRTTHSEKLFENGTPKCIGEEFPDEWIKKKIAVNKYAYTKCDISCNVRQFPFLGHLSGNQIAHIKGNQKVFLNDEITIIDGHSATRKSWHKTWYSFVYQNKTYYISKLNIEK
jgi:hypothetical protein